MISDKLIQKLRHDIQEAITIYLNDKSHTEFNDQAIEIHNVHKVKANFDSTKLNETELKSGRPFDLVITGSLYAHHTIQKEKKEAEITFWIAPKPCTIIYDDQNNYFQVLGLEYLGLVDYLD